MSQNVHRLERLTVLRGCAALMVFLFHQKGRLPETGLGALIEAALCRSGYLGVDLFFVLSGFVLCFSTRKTQSPLGFLVRRVFRIWPCLLLSVGVMALTRTDLGALQALKSLLLIPLDFSARPPWFGYGYNPSVWTLSYEVYFYALFALALAVSPRNRGGLTALLVVLPLFLIHGLEGSWMTRLDPYERIQIPAVHGQDIARLAGNAMVLEFVLGVCAYGLYCRLETMPRMAAVRGLGWLLIGTFVLAYVLFLRPGHGPLHAGFWSVLLLLGVLLLELGSAPTRTPLRGLGEVSYSLYLLSVPLHEGLSRLWPELILTRSWEGLMVEAAVLLLGSWLSFRLIERPLIERGRMLGSRLDPGMPNARAFFYKKRGSGPAMVDVNRASLTRREKVS